MYYFACHPEFISGSSLSFPRKPRLTWRKRESRKITGSPIRSGMTKDAEPSSA